MRIKQYVANIPHHDPQRQPPWSVYSDACSVLLRRPGLLASVLFPWVTDRIVLQLMISYSEGGVVISTLKGVASYQAGAEEMIYSTAPSLLPGSLTQRSITSFGSVHS